MRFRPNGNQRKAGNSRFDAGAFGSTLECTSDDPTLGMRFGGVRCQCCDPNIRSRGVNPHTGPRNPQAVAPLSLDEGIIPMKKKVHEEKGRDLPHES